MKKILPLVLAISIFQNSINAQCPPYPAALGCGLAIPNCAGIDGYCNTLIPQTQTTEVMPGCGGMSVINNDDWLAFYAGTEIISIVITPSNCQSPGGNIGIQGGIYATCEYPGGVNDDGLASEPLAIQCSCSTTPITLSYDNFVVGQIYYLLIDGCGGDICDYEIDVITGSTTSTEIVEQTGDIQGNNSFCSGDIATFSIDSVEFATFYDWTTDSNASVINGQGTSEVEIAIEAEGNIEICVTPSNGCFVGTESCITVNSMGVVQTSILVESFCEGDSIEFEGQFFSESGLFSFVYAGVNGCDSILNLDLTVTEIYEVNIDTTVCGILFFEVGDSVYFQDGSYEIVLTSSLGCDSTVYLELEFGQYYETFVDTIMEPGGIYNGIVYEYNAEIVEVYSAVSGCDSVVIINIMIDPDATTFPESIEQLTVFPNPASNIVFIELDLKEAIELNLDIYNTFGHSLNDLALTSRFSKGNHTIELNATQLANGTYFLQFRTEKGNISQRLVIAR